MFLNERGFTLMEMLIVLFIISILLFITLPNLNKQNTVINDKGCEAYKDIVQAQVEIYKLEHNGMLPTDLDELVNEGYIPSKNCPNSEIELSLSDVLNRTGE